MLRVVRVEGEAFDHEPVREEEDWTLVDLLEAFHTGRHRLHLLLLRDKVQLFDPLLQYLRVDLSRHVVPVLWSLELELLSDSVLVEGALAPAAAFSADPLEAVVGKELGHFNRLRLVAVPLDGQARNVVDVLVARRHRQVLVQILQANDLVVFLAQLVLEYRVERFKLLVYFELGLSLRGWPHRV